MLPEGFEPSTQRFEDARSRPLSYGSGMGKLAVPLFSCKDIDRFKAALLNQFRRDLRRNHADADSVPRGAEGFSQKA